MAEDQFHSGPPPRFDIAWRELRSILITLQENDVPSIAPHTLLAIMAQLQNTFADSIITPRGGKQ